MGYTIEKGKKVIWSVKRFVPDKYPLHDFGENITSFYHNLKDNNEFLKCESKIPTEEKEALVSQHTGFLIGTFVIRSKQRHYEKLRKAKATK